MPSFHKKRYFILRLTLQGWVQEAPPKAEPKEGLIKPGLSIGMEIPPHSKFLMERKPESSVCVHLMEL